MRDYISPLAKLHDKNIVLAFIRDRLTAMAAHPTTWASGQEAFILQLVLLAEVSHIGTPERFADRQQAMLAELCKPDTSWAVSNNPITTEWAAQAVQVTRKYVMP